MRTPRSSPTTTTSPRAIRDPLASTSTSPPAGPISTTEPVRSWEQLLHGHPGAAQGHDDLELDAGDHVDAGGRCSRSAFTEGCELRRSWV
jgi:hypothetical protein